MSVSRVYSAQTLLLSVTPIEVETDLARGLFAFSIVGLPDKAVEEAKDRVGAAIKNSGLTSPKSKNQKVVISLAPASERKEGASFDLAIALSYLLAAEEIDFDPKGKIFLGELALDGTLRPVRGALPVARFAKEHGFKEIFVPQENAKEAALIDGVQVYGAGSLAEVLKHLSGEKLITETAKTIFKGKEVTTTHDFSDVRGQERAKRGLLIAAAGGHNVAMYGPPGTGKTMLARAFAGILPPLTFDEALEATSIYSVAGLPGFVSEPPFRSPHHTASYVSLVGGGATPRPGEITLAHRGVLFMDEFPEFERRVIESLRQPLEEKYISVARAKGTAKFPADVILVAAMNPCPCGNFGFRGKPCICSPGALQRYRRKMSGPIMDRIDIWLEVDRVLASDLSAGLEQGSASGEKSSEFKNKVTGARTLQKTRFEKSKTKLTKNAEMSPRDLVSSLSLTPEAKQALNLAAERLGFSPRVYHRMLKVARTIADLEGSPEITRDHILEAVEYRPKKFDI